MSGDKRLSWSAVAVLGLGLGLLGCGPAEVGGDDVSASRGQPLSETPSDAESDLAPKITPTASMVESVGRVEAAYTGPDYDEEWRQCGRYAIHGVVWFTNYNKKVAITDRVCLTMVDSDAGHAVGGFTYRVQEIAQKKVWWSTGWQKMNGSTFCRKLSGYNYQDWEHMYVHLQAGKYGHKSCAWRIYPLEKG